MGITERCNKCENEPSGNLGSFQGPYAAHTSLSVKQKCLTHGLSL
uniref:Uncharacterized protein n=1 Tax=Anguilla anguilla TaxID=7936 RepID=A0A0E9SBG1_ANGAN